VTDVEWATPPIKGRALSNLNLRSNPDEVAAPVIAVVPEGSYIGIVGTARVQRPDGKQYLPAIWVHPDTGEPLKGWLWSDLVETGTRQ